jgi:hypothetical protein
MRMTKIILPAALALVGSGCSNNTATDGATMHDMAMAMDMAMAKMDMAVQPMPDMAMPPAAPTLGTQIDRMGRPTINVAVTNPFGLNKFNGNYETTDATRDRYNQDSDPTNWVANWVQDIAATLAIYDGADTICGNQVGACASLTGCTNQTPDMTRYIALAGLLADDKVYLDTTKATCRAYLAVETAAVLAGGAERGGRTPLFNVVHETYTAAVTGVAGFMGNDTYAITDGVAADGDGTVSLTTFPFLGDPN